MIKQFRFRLERVLRHRANLLELRERALAEVEAQLVRERGVLAELLGLKAEVLGDLAGLQAAAFEAGERELYQQYLDWVGAEQDRELRLIAELEALRDAKREEVVRAQQDHKIVDRLRERQQAVYRGEVARVEQAALDEIATAKFARVARGEDDVLPEGAV